MRRVVLQMHVSLDGYADSRDGFVPMSDRGYAKELDRALSSTGAADVDTLLLGRGTYQQFLQFWPGALTDPSTPADLRSSAKFLTETPKVVFSKSLKKATWQNTTIVRGGLAREIARLKRTPGRNLLVLGGVAFPRALIEKDLVDEYLLSIVPIVLGQGRYRLFGRWSRPRKLSLVRAWTFKNGIVLHQYRRAR